MELRVGAGFDAHSVDVSRPLVLGGVEIEGAPGLAGHSDADVLSHAVADALLGAASLGDLGDRFPATEQWKDASSLEILKQTRALVVAAGWEIVNVDATVVAEAPRLGPHRAAMAAGIGEALGLAEGLVSVKATTSDGLGFTGRREGIAAFATVLLRRP